VLISTGSERDHTIVRDRMLLGVPLDEPVTR
jgi:hypothetical protein